MYKIQKYNNIIYNDQRRTFIYLWRRTYICLYNIRLNGARPTLRFSRNWILIYWQWQRKRTFLRSVHPYNDWSSMESTTPHYFSYDFNARDATISFALSMRNKFFIYSSRWFLYENKPVVIYLNMCICKAVCSSISVVGVCTLSKVDYRLVEKKERREKARATLHFTSCLINVSKMLLRDFSSRQV